MKTRWMIAATAVVALVVGTAEAQTTATTAPRARPAATAVPAGVATTAVPVAQPVSVAVFDQAPPPVPPVPPVPAAAAAGPQAPQAPPAPRAPRVPVAARSTGDAPVPPEARHARGQLLNLRLEFTVTDQIGTAPPVRKIITMNVADGESGRIRTNAEVFRKNSAPTNVPLSVDASPEIDGTKIRLRASLEYQLLKDPEPDLPAGKTSITQMVTAVLNDGVSTILSQSADPLTDRKVTLEVKATIIK
jgi:hypothetical protein